MSTDTLLEVAQKVYPKTVFRHTGGELEEFVDFFCIRLHYPFPTDDGNGSQNFTVGHATCLCSFVRFSRFGGVDRRTRRDVARESPPAAVEDSPSHNYVSHRVGVVEPDCEAGVVTHHPGSQTRG